MPFWFLIFCKKKMKLSQSPLPSCCSTISQCYSSTNIYIYLYIRIMCTLQGKIQILWIQGIEKLLCWLLTFLFLCSLFLDFLLLDLWATGFLLYFTPIFHIFFFYFLKISSSKFFISVIVFLISQSSFFPQVCFLQKSSVLFLLHECNRVSYLFEDIHGILWGNILSSCIACISYSYFFLIICSDLSFIWVSQCRVILTCQLTLFNFLLYASWRAGS